MVHYFRNNIKTHVYIGRDDLLLLSKTNILKNMHERHVVYCPYEPDYFLEYSKFSRELENIPNDHPLRDNFYHVFLAHDYTDLRKVEKSRGPSFSKNSNWSMFYMHYSTSRFINENPGYQNSDDPSKLFCCLNKNPKIHRMAAIKTLDDLNLFDKGAITWLPTDREKQALEFLSAQHADYFNGATAIKHLENKIYSEPNASLEGDWICRCPNIYKDCLFDIVTESEWEICMWSEKTARPLLLGKPFVILGGRNSNTELKKFGFESYDEFFNINEEINLSHVLEDRIDYDFDVYGKILKPLCAIDEDLTVYKNILQSLQPKIKHNQSVFIRTLFDDSLIPELVWEIPREHNKYLNRILDTRIEILNHKYYKQFI